MCACVSTEAMFVMALAIYYAPRALAGDGSGCTSSLKSSGEASCRQPQLMTVHYRYDSTFEWSCVLSGSMDLAGLAILTCMWWNRTAVSKWII